MFCCNCGRKIGGTDKFCMSCGTSVGGTGNDAAGPSFEQFMEQRSIQFEGAKKTKEKERKGKSIKKGDEQVKVSPLLVVWVCIPAMHQIMHPNVARIIAISFVLIFI